MDVNRKFNLAPFNYLLNNEMRDNEKIFKLSKAILNDNDELVIQLLVNSDDYDNLLNDELKDRVENVVKTLIPEGINFNIVYRKTETTERYVMQNVHEFFINESDLIYGRIKTAKIEIEINYGTVLVKMGVTPDMFGYLVECNYNVKLADYLETFLMEEVEVEFYRIEDKREHGLRKVRSASTVRPSERIVDAKINVNYYGMVSRKPVYIIDAIKKERESISICGLVSDVKELKSKAGKTFFKASVDDTTGKVDFLCFPRFPAHIEAIKTYLLENTEVCVEGELKMDERSGNYVMFARRLAQCQIDYASISTEIIYNEAPEFYSKVFPESYVETEQAVLFNNEVDLPELLKGKIVVFDLETTGLSAQNGKIIEIGAVSMVDGVIMETFSTLIDPECHIPEDATAVNNIHDEDVLGAPYFKDVVGDFYLFCKDATLCGHNVGFDIGFLTYHAKKEFYNFDNPLIDTLALAQRLLKRSTRNKLGDLCKEFDIELTNAHRALFDTIATAKVLKKLAYISEN